MENGQITGHIATSLNEKREKPIKQITEIIEHFGAEVALAMLDETLAIQTAGGMRIKKGTRKRSLGGIYFRLARDRAVQERIKAGISPLPAQEQFPEFSWSDRMTVIQNLLRQIGEVSSVKATLIGRPGRIERRDNLIITTMRYTPKDSVTLPRGVPRPPTSETLYTVYISQKQWNKIANAVMNPDDSLIVEGLCIYDPKLPGIALFAQIVTTKLTQRGLRSGD